MVEWQTRGTGDWLGARPALEDHGISLTGKWIGTFYGVAAGGLEQRGAFDQSLHFDLKVDFAKLTGWSAKRPRGRATALPLPLVPCCNCGLGSSRSALDQNLPPQRYCDATPPSGEYVVGVEVAGDDAGHGTGELDDAITQQLRRRAAALFFH